MGISYPAIRFKQCTIHAHKVTKASNSNIAQVGNNFSLSLDDTLILAQIRKMTRECLVTAPELLGFIINLKSVLNLTQKIELWVFRLTTRE